MFKKLFLGIVCLVGLIGLLFAQDLKLQNSEVVPVEEIAVLENLDLAVGIQDELSQETEISLPAVGSETLQSQTLSFSEIPSNYNLLKNSSFESWSKGINNKAPDAWVISNIISSRDSANKKIGSYCTKLGYKTGSSSVIYQDIPELDYYKGKRLTVGVWVKASIANQTRLFLYDGANYSNSSYHSGSGTYEYIRIDSVDFSSTATVLRIGITVAAAGSTPYIDGVFLYELITDTAFIPTDQDDLKIPSNLIYTDLANQFVGIGTPNPKLKLDVNGPARMQGTFSTAPTVGSGLELLYNNSSGYGLIQAYDRATSTLKNLYLQNQQFLFSPDGNLEVSGSIKAIGSILSGNNEVLTQTSADALYVNQVGDTMTGDLTVQGNINVSGNITSLKFLGDGSELTNLPLLWTKKEGTEDIYYDKGNVGIGTTNPKGVIHIYGGDGVESLIQNSAYPSGSQLWGIQAYQGNLNFRTLNDDASVEVGVGKMMSLTRSGNVGIGTTGPGSGTIGRGGATFASPVLEVYSTGRPALTIRSDNTNNLATIVMSANNSAFKDTHINQGFDGSLSFYQYSASVPTTVTFDPSGNVGIGTMGPEAKLDIYGGSDSYIATQFSGSNWRSFRINKDDVSLRFQDNWGGDWDDRLTINSYYDQVLLNPTGGNVGIGTTEPNYMLHVGTGNQGIRIEGPSSSGTGARTFSMGGFGDFGIDAYGVVNGRFVVTESGNVGIGKTDINYKLDVAGDINGNRICIGSDCRSSWPNEGGGSNLTGAGDLNYISKWTSTTSLAKSIIYDTGDKVGIGTTQPLARLHIEGDLNIGGEFAYPDPNLSNHSDKNTQGTIAWYLERMKTTGGTIYLQPGTYSINSHLTLYNNISIVGSGFNSIIQAGSSYSDDDALLINNGAYDGKEGEGIDNVLLTNFMLDGNGKGIAGMSTNSDGGSEDYLNRITIRGLRIVNCKTGGLVLGNVHGLIISDTYLLDNGTDSIDAVSPDHNIYLRRVERVHISNVTTSGASSDGLHIAIGEDINISNVHAYGNNGRGVFLAEVDSVTLTNTNARDNGGSGYSQRTDGIEIVGDDPYSDGTGTSNNISIHGCVSKDNKGKATGIFVGETNILTISSCAISGNDDDGIYLRNSTQVSVTGNSLYSNGDYGIQESGSSNEVVVGNNIVNNSSGDSNGGFTLYANNN